MATAVPPVEQPGGSLLATAARYVPVGLALFAIQLDFFSLSLAMPTISRDLGVPVTDLQWLLSAYLLSLGASFVPAGKVGDLIGRKRALMIGLVVFGATSLVCGLAPDAGLLIAFRAVQGIGAALIMPNAFALMGASLGEEHRAKVMGLMLGIAGVGTALGPVVGGVLASTAGWRWVFFINLPVALIALLGAQRLHESYGTGHRRSLRDLDWPGVVLVMAGLAALSIGVDDVSTFGIASPATWGPLTAGVLLLVAFGLRESRAASPLVRPALLRNRAYVLLVTASTVANVGLNIGVLVATLDLQSVRGLPAGASGLVFMLGSIGLAVGGPVSGWLTGRFGAPWVLCGALVVGAGALLALAAAPDLVVFVIALGITGFACGMGYSVSQIGIPSILPADQVGEASSLLLTVLVSVGGIAVVAAGAVIELQGPVPTTASLDSTLLGTAVLLGAVGLVTLTAAVLRMRRRDVSAPASV